MLGNVLLPYHRQYVPDHRTYSPLITDIKLNKETVACFDEVMFLFRPSYYSADTEFPNIAELEVAVHPEGKTGVAVLGYDSNSRLFHNLEQRSEMNLGEE